MSAIDHRRLVGTLGKSADLGHDLWMNCQSCGHNVLHRYEDLVSAFGRDRSTADWSATHVCNGCSGVGTARLQVSVRANPQHPHYHAVSPGRIDG